MLSPGVTYNNGIFRLVKLKKPKASLNLCWLPSFSSVPGMIGQGTPFTSQQTISSAAGLKHSQPNISTVTTATQSMIPQQQVAPNQQPVPPQGPPLPSQQPQAPPQQQPTPNQPTAPSAQPNMVSSHNEDKVDYTYAIFFIHLMRLKQDLWTFFTTGA